MAATTRPSTGSGTLRRFDGVERALHWVNAAVFAILVFTGACLYLEPLDALIGRRNLIENIHVWTGVVMPIPLLLSIAGPWGASLRSDLGRFNRWTRHDFLWLRAAFGERTRRRALHRQLDTGKFNAGQKLNAAWTAGAGLVMLGTGAVMKWYHPWPLAWRTGATFVHDWLALAVGLVIIGHIGMALRDPESLRSMWHGRIGRRWAERHAPAWLREEEA
jgi:formate dehydrogenase subunit gamma